MDMRLGGADQSLNAPVGNGSEDDWQDFLPDRRPNPEQAVAVMRDDETRSRWLAEAMGELSPRERAIIRERRLRDEGATLEELGRVLGVSKERVRQIEIRAIRKLKKSLTQRTASIGEIFMEVV